MRGYKELATEPLLSSSPDLVTSLQQVPPQCPCRMKTEQFQCPF